MDKPVPYDLAAERAVLGSCLIERETIIGVRGLVASADFYLEKHALIYDAILECLDNKVPPDFITVRECLNRHDTLTVAGGEDLLFKLIDYATSEAIAVHADHYARIVARCARSRRLIELGGQIAASGYNNDPDQAIEEAEQLLSLERTIAANADDWQGHIRDGRDIWAKKFVPRPFIIEGIMPIGVTMIHGLPKTKKSWFMLGASYAVAGGGKALGQLQALAGEVLYLDLEMDEELSNERLRVKYPTEAPPAGVKFFYQWPTIDNGFFSRLENYLRARPYTRMVVVDTLVRVFPDETRDGYRQDSKLIDPFVQFCKGKGVGITLIYHSRKLGGSGDPILGASGSTGITGSVDSVLELRNDENEPSKGMLLRRGRRLKDDSKIPMKWDVQLGSWAVDQRAGELTPERRAVLRVVEERGFITPAKIAVLIDRPAPSVRRLCQEMQVAGQLINMQGAYGMPYDESQIA
jgi:hypothetical protein